jgi:hypothetical protein
MYRILDRIRFTGMKVTAIIDDKTIEDAMKYSNSSTITDALKVALKEYINSQKLKELGRMIKADPMEFSHSAEDIRNINREV